MEISLILAFLVFGKLRLVSLIVDTLKKARNVTDRHVFLFDQLLVFCKFHRSARPDKPLYKFKGSVMIRKTEIFDVDDTEGDLPYLLNDALIMMLFTFKPFSFVS